MTAPTSHRGRRAKAEAVQQKFRDLIERMLWPHFGSQNGVATRCANDLIADMTVPTLRYSIRMAVAGGADMTAQLITDLRDARALVAKGWCRYHFATDRRGKSVSALSGKARRVCMLGGVAIVTQSFDDANPRNKALWQALCRAIGVTSIVQWQDTAGRTKREVLAAFDRAHELAERESA